MSQSSHFDANSAQPSSLDSPSSNESVPSLSKLEMTSEDAMSGVPIIQVIDGSHVEHLFEKTVLDQPQVQFKAGQFTVEASGIVRIAFSPSTPKLGEIALFSLTGLETLAPDSSAFRQAAIDRASSNSTLGCVLNLEAETDSQTKVYKHQITLEPGTQFGLMWSRTQAISTVQSLNGLNPSDLVFSIPAANRQTIAQFGQFTTANGTVLFGFAAPQIDAIDTPVLDVVALHILGATGKAAPLDLPHYATEAWAVIEERPTDVTAPINEIADAPIPIAVEPILSAPLELAEVINVDASMLEVTISELEAAHEAVEVEGFNAATMATPITSFAAVQSFTTPTIGHVKLVWRNYTTGVNELWVVENEQVVRRVPLPSTPPGDWRLQGCLDMTRDGYADLLWHHAQGGGIVVWQMQGAASVAAYNILPVISDPNWQVVGVADFNRDGRPELLWRHRLSGETLYWILDAAGRNAIGSVSLPTVDSGWQIQAVGSFTGDGSTDLLWRNPSSGENAYWSVNGSQVQGGFLPNAPGSEWRIQGCADFNGDGKADILWRNVNTGETAVWFMNGTTVVRAVFLPTQPAWQDWRAILPFVWNAPQPSIQLQLANDTGANGINTDRLTSEATIRGQITAQQNIKQLLIRLISSSTSIDITNSIQPDKTFTVTSAQLQQLNNNQPLIDGTYTIEATLLDVHHNPSNPATLTFTLDRTAPTTITIDLPDAQDTGSSATDNITRNRTLTFVGTAEPGMQVELMAQGAVIATTTTAANGTWQATVTRPADGVHAISAVAIDAAGNRTATPATLNVTIDSLPPQITLTTPIQSPINQASRLTGSINGTGSAISSATYRFGNQALQPISINAGAFDQAFNFSGVANGTQTLTITTADIAGNLTTASWQVTVAVDTTAPAMTATLQRDTAPNNGTNQDGITFDLTIMGTVNDANRIDAFEARLSNTASWVNVLPQRRADGTFTLTRAQLEAVYGQALPDGTYTLQLRARDQFNNTGSTSIPFTLDTRVQPPQNLQLTSGSDSGSSSSDRITRIQTPTITGSAEPNAIVQIRQNTTTIATALADPQGNWQATLPALTNGTHTFVAIAVDIAGNVSAASSPLMIQVDAQAPSVPTIALSSISDSGTSNTDQITNRAALTLTGSTEANTIIKLFHNNQEIRQVTETASGTWQVTLAALSDGVHRFSAIAVDAAGNESSMSAAIVITIDTIAQPSIPQLRSDSTGTSATERISRSSTVTIGGTSEPNATIQILNNGNTIGTVRADVVGQWQQTITLPEGQAQIQTIVTDIAGNSSLPTALNILVDGMAPQLTLASPASDAVISGKTFLSGTLVDAGSGIASLRYQIDGVDSGAITVNSTGQFNQAMNLRGLTIGAHTLRITAIDRAGNVAQRTQSFTVNFVVDFPLAIEEIALVEDTIGATGMIGDGITSNPAVRLQLSQMRDWDELQGWFGQSAPVIFPTPRQADGSVQLSLADLERIYGGKLPEDQLLTLNLEALDSFSNRSATASISFALDTIKPKDLSLLLKPGDDTGRSDSDFNTYKNAVTLIGTAEAGTSIEVLMNGNRLAEPFISTGFWTMMLPVLMEGVYSIRVNAIDVAGNTQTLTLRSGLRIDTEAPESAQGLQFVENADGPSVNGTAEPNADIVLLNHGQPVGTAIVQPDGTWRVALPDLAEGEHLFVATTRDAAGNEGPASAPLAVRYVKAPHSLQLVTATDSGTSSTDCITKINPPQITGKARPGAVVQLFDGEVWVGEQTADDQGDWTITTTILSEGEHRLIARAVSASGMSQPSSELKITIDTTPPTLQLDRLFDHDAWYSDERLSGTIEDSNIDEIIYQFEAGAELSLKLTDSYFQIARPSDYKAGEIRTLNLVVRDRAGNETIVDPIRFLVPVELLVVDDDPEDSEDDDSNPSPGGGGGSSGGGGGTWNWTWENTEINGGGGGNNSAMGHPLPPNVSPIPPSGPEPTGCGYRYDYAAKIDQFVENAVNQLDALPRKQQALEKRRELIEAIANSVDGGKFYAGMNRALYGLFVDPNGLCVRDEDRRNIGDSGLSSAIRQDPASVKLRVYQATLLAAANFALVPHGKTLANNPDNVVDSLLRMAFLYAGLDPQGEAGRGMDFGETSDPRETDILDSLWRSQQVEDYAAAPYNDGIYALRSLLKDSVHPIRALKCSSDLLRTAIDMERLHTAIELNQPAPIRDAQFLRELIAFGFEYLKANPKALANPSQGSSAFFMDTLLREGYGSKARQQMRDFFAGVQFGIPPLILVRFARMVVNALVPPIQTFAQQEPQFLGELLAMVMAYAAANPQRRGGGRPYQVTTPFPQTRHQDLFLRFWRDPASVDAFLNQDLKGIEMLLERATSPTQRVERLRLSRNLLLASLYCPNLQQPNLRFLDSLVLRIGKDYADLELQLAGTASDELFLHLLSSATHTDVISNAAISMNQFFEGVTAQAALDQRLQFAQTLLQTAKQLRSSSSLSTSSRDAAFIGHLINLGGAYASLNPQPADEFTDPELFLSTLWKDRNIAKASSELEKLLSNLPNASAMLGLGHKLLLTHRAIPELEVQLSEVETINTWLTLVAVFARSQAVSQPDYLSGVLLNLWQAGSLQEIKLATRSLQTTLLEENAFYYAGASTDEVLIASSMPTIPISPIPPSGTPYPGDTAIYTAWYEVVRNPASGELALRNLSDGVISAFTLSIDNLGGGRFVIGIGYSGALTMDFRILRNGRSVEPPLNQPPYDGGTELLLAPGDRILYPVALPSNSPSQAAPITEQQADWLAETLHEILGTEITEGNFFEKLTFKRVLVMLGELVAGAIYAYLKDVSAPTNLILRAMGPFQQYLDESAEESKPKSLAFIAGELLGNTAAIATGILEFKAGGGAVLGGKALCITGIGCLGGAPAIAVGAVLASSGLVTANAGVESARINAGRLIEHLHILFSKGAAGETTSTAIGKRIHAKRAQERRDSDEYDLVNQPIKDKDGNEIQVPKRYDLKTGEPQAGAPLQSAQPDAVDFEGGVIIDDKPLGRNIMKDRQEIIRFIKAYQQREGKLPERIEIHRYDPKDPQDLGPKVIETYSPEDFLPKPNVAN